MPKTHVALILDRSGSMGPVKDQTIAGFNDQLATLLEMQTDDQKVGVTLTIFNTTVSSVYFDQPVSSVEPLTQETYQPGGWTALYDAVGTTIMALEDNIAAKDDDSFLVMVFSDGDDRGPLGKDRGSSEYTAATLANVIERLQKTGKWTFTYLGTNHDLAKVATTLGLPVGNVCSYTAERTNVGFEASRARTRKYFAARSCGATAVNSFYSEESKIANADTLVENETK